MKKIFKVLVAVALSMCLLLGCSSPTDVSKENLTIKIGSLKGPTSMGLLYLMPDIASDCGELKGRENYSFEMFTTADEILPKMMSGDLDIALIPANVASVLYNKSQGAVSVIDINTLGVLYCVSDDPSITTVSDLKGKTIYVTNKGTTPDYTIRYLLASAGISENEVNIEYKSEALEVAATLAKESGSVGVLPQPFATACCIQNENLHDVLDLTGEWEKVAAEESKLLTGVTVVRKDFLKENPEAVEQFLKDHKTATDFAVENVEAAAELTVKAGIIEKAPLAAKALPKCNIVCITGKDMKEALEGYLSVLYDMEPTSVGGSLPDSDFYYE